MKVVFVVFLCLVVVLAMFSCSKTQVPDHTDEPPAYTTDYLDSKIETKTYIRLSEKPGSISDYFSKAQLVAEIRVLGLSNIYNGDKIPFSVYVGEILETFKDNTGQNHNGYIYISRYGTARNAVADLNFFKPEDTLLLFLQKDEKNVYCAEQPLFCGCSNGFFENLYIYETNGNKYILPDTLDDFLPQEIPAIADDLALEINKKSNIYRRNNKVYDYKIVINFIEKEINK